MSLLNQMKSPRLEVAVSPGLEAREEESQASQEIDEVLIVNLEAAFLNQEEATQDQPLARLEAQARAT